MRFCESMRAGAATFLRAYENMCEHLGLDSICSVCEFQDPIELATIVEKLNAEVIFGRMDITIWGYTVHDSMKAIIEMLPDQFQKIYGRSTARALIFTGFLRQIAMVAVRVSNLKPGAVVLQGLMPSRSISSPLKSPRSRIYLF